MSNIRVLTKQFPKKGRFIAEGSYNYFHTPDGLPAFAFRWQGMFLPGAKATFVFARDTVRIGRLSDDVTKNQARMGAFSRNAAKGAGAGILGSLIAGAIGSATGGIGNMKGFGLYYNNEDGHLGGFVAAASPEIVDEIFRSIPAERIEKDPEPANNPPTT